MTENPIRVMTGNPIPNRHYYPKSFRIIYMDNAKDPRNQDDQLIGTAIESRYEVVRLIDAGGMASVYRAWDQRLQRDVALKIMHPHLAHNAALIARFEAEAQATAKLTHPHIVQIFDQGVWRGRSYLVMEFINGPSLRHYLSKQNTLSVKEALTITRSILLALDHAHKCQIIHRDIKPENILLTPKGEIKVVDFGLAHAINQATGATTGQIMGTVCYIAPEIITRDFSDERADLYAVGVMLFEMIYGKLPFATSTSISAVWAQVNHDIPALAQLLEDFPLALSDFTAKLCQREITKRYLSAQAALQACENLLDVLSGEELDYHFLPQQFSDQYPCADSHKTAAFPIIDPAEAPYPLPESEENNPSLGNYSSNVQSDTATGVIPSIDSLDSASSAESDTHLAIGQSALPESLSTDLDKRPEFDELTQVDPPVAKNKRRNKVLLSLLLLILLCVGSGVAWYFLYGPGAKVVIPDVSGKTQVEAEKILRDHELLPQVKTDFSDEIAPGKAIGTTPDKGQKLRKNSPISLRISKGVEMVKVPDLRNKDFNEAKALLAKSKLKLGKTTQVFDEEIAKDRITAQSLEAGARVKHDSVIDLNISKGREPFKVPEITGKSLDEAKSLLEAVHLVIEVEEKYSDTITRGTIIDQEVKAGEERYRGDKVKVQLSLGPEFLIMPTLAGKSMDEAKAEAERLGFKVNIEKQLLGIAPGRVYSQYPGAGSRVRSGSTITLTYV